MEIAEAAGGVLALAAQLVLATGVTLAAAERPSFLAPTLNHRGAAFIAGPLAGLWPALTRETSMLRWDATLALLAMLACWALAVACARSTGLAAVMVTAVLADVVLVLAPPFSLADTFNYLHYGRMAALYGLNPYTHLPIAAARRSRLPAQHLAPPARAPTGRCSRWPRRRSRRSASRPPTGCLKVAVGAAAIAVAVLVALLARGSGATRRRAVAFVALNPLVLVYGSAGVHNDVLRAGAAARRRAARAGPARAARRRRVGGRRGDQAARPASRSRSSWRASRRRLRAAAGVAIVARRGARAGAGRLRRAPAQRRRAGAAGGEAQPREPARHRRRARRPRRHAARGARGRPRAGHGRRCALWTWRTRDWTTAAAWAAALLILTLGWVMPWYVLWVLPFAALSRPPAPTGGGDRAHRLPARHVGARGRTALHRLGAARAAPPTAARTPLHAPAAALTRFATNRGAGGNRAGRTLGTMTGQLATLAPLQHRDAPPTPLAGVSIVLPCFDEAENVAAAVREAAWPAGRRAPAHEVIVVDDGSTRRHAGDRRRRSPPATRRVRVVVHDQQPRLRRGAALGHRGRAPAVGAADRRRPAVRPRRSSRTSCRFAADHDLIVGDRIVRCDPPRAGVDRARLEPARPRACSGCAVRDVDCAFKLVRRELLAELAARPPTAR